MWAQDQATAACSDIGRAKQVYNKEHLAVVYNVYTFFTLLGLKVFV